MDLVSFPLVRKAFSSKSFYTIAAISEGGRLYNFESAAFASGGERVEAVDTERTVVKAD